MKKHILALLLAATLATPTTTQPISKEVCGNILLLLANSGSTFQWLKTQQRSVKNGKATSWTHWTHCGTCCYLYGHAIGGLWRAYKQYKNDQDNITVKGSSH